MGQVWLAEQTEPVRRRVALKLIKAGLYDDTIAQRFLSERQSLAMMEHPAIAKVFDAGATSARRS
jgi:non-specific serine/threonine protein kinase/serine/threonine-protein kinase